MIKPKQCAVCKSDIPMISIFGNPVSPRRYAERQTCNDKSCRSALVTGRPQGTKSRPVTKAQGRSYYATNSIQKVGDGFYLYFNFMKYKVGLHGFIFHEIESNWQRSSMELKDFISTFSQLANKENAPAGAKAYLATLRKIKPVKRPKVRINSDVSDQGSYSVGAI